MLNFSLSELLPIQGWGMGSENRGKAVGEELQKTPNSKIIAANTKE